MGEPERSQRLVRFEGFELDLRTCELRQNGEKAVRLSEQPFRILTILLDRPGDLVTREEIRNKLWPNGTIVEFEHSISAAINRLRQVLSDSAEDPRYIETLARLGYRWMIPLKWVDATPLPPGAPGVSISESITSLLTGKKVSHYRVLEILGGGGMGVVYQAEDLKLGRRVALKFLPEELASDPAALKRMEHEARAASTLNHPNICTIYEIEEHESQPFIVMELLEGETLRELISATTAKTLSLPLEKLLDLAIQITEGLRAAHEKGIIHRDIKPANIFVTPQGQAKILDFGVAKLALPETAAETLERIGNTEAAATGGPKEAVSAADSNPFLSRTGVAIGTAGYMSPEQARGEKLDARTDLFSFGLVLYEMATGQRAFKGDTGPVLLEAILNRTPTAVRELKPELPVRLEVIINKALEKDRNLRYQSAADLRTDLQSLKRETDSEGPAAASETAAVSASTKKEKSTGMKDGAAFQRLPWRVIVGIAAVALALAVPGAYFYLHRAPRLTDKDTIVLADFTNTTGDPVFDDTLKQALAIQLEQSPFLSLVSEQRVQQTLRMMGQQADARVTSKIARELCQRAEGAAVLEGAIASLGSDYVLGLKAVNCRTGDLLAQEQGTATSKEQVLKVLDATIVKMRGKLGESLATVQKFDTRLEEATTTSLAALQAYTLGLKAMTGKDGSAAAIPFLQRAIKIDPNFAMAYTALGASYSNLAEKTLASESARKAFELRERVSERERLTIESLYHQNVTGDLEKAM